MHEYRFENIDLKILNWFEKEIANCSCCIKKQEWKSKYNNYVVYDYEPFCTDGFKLNLIVKGDVNHLKFLKFIYDKRLKLMDYINNCYKNEKVTI